VRGLFALALIALTIGVAPCQTPDQPLVPDITWQTPSAAPTAARLGGAPSKQIGIAALPTAPVLDGSLDDPAWEAAATTDAWMDVSGSAEAPVQTQAWVGRIGERLYLAVRCTEPNIAGVRAEVTEDGGSVWNDDCVELFFDGNLDKETYRQIGINSLGVVTAFDRADAEWSPAIERGALVGEGQWSVELSIGISDLAILGNTFGLNFCRERRADGDTELSCWSPTGKGFGQPASFGLAMLGASYLKSFHPGDAAVGLNSVAVVMLNDSEEAQRLRVRLQWWQGDEIAREAFSSYQELAPGAERKVTIPYTISHAGEPVTLEVVVLDERGASLAQRALVKPIRPPMGSVLGQSLFFLDEAQAGMQVRLDVGEDLLRDRGQLIVALFEQPSMSLIARQEITPLAAPVLSARLALPELKAGSYSLHVILKQPGLDGPLRVAEDIHAIRVLPSRLRD